VAQKHLLIAGDRRRISAINYTHRQNVDDMVRSGSDRCQSQILVENRDFLPLLGRGFTSEYCQNVWYGKTRPVRVSDSAKCFPRYVYSFRQNTRIRRTDAAQRHRAHLCMALCGKNIILTLRLNCRPQFSHINSRCDECRSRCSFSLSGRGNVFPQSVHV